ncbi:MAG: hypothetical protein ACRER3_21150 [Pseudomonas fluorescens]
MKKSTCYLGLLLALAVPSAEAANQEIRALFQPDPSQPHKNVFLNKTPNSGYCASYPSECATNNMFSIRLPTRFDSTRAIEPGEGVPLKVPANWRQLTVTNAQTLETELVEVRIIGIGSEFHLSDSAANLTGVTDNLEGHQKLWSSSSWVYAPPPCQYSGVGAYGTHSYRFFWKAPQEAYCVKVAAFRIPSMYFNTLDFAYELRTPNPLGMSSGLYTGAISYTMGSGADFDFGPYMVPDDGSLTLDFVLDVQHTLKVDLPPGGNRIALEPEGGWQPWLNTGRIPNRLYRDQAFHISASSRFKMFLQCNTPGACFLFSDPPTSAAKMNISVTLPRGLTDTSARPVVRQELLPSESAAVVFQPGMYVDNKQGTLHFDMDKKSIEAILKRDREKHYSNTIVVVFDSEI